MTFVDYNVTSNEETVETQVASARDERDKVALWGRILPITFIAIGLVSWSAARCWDRSACARSLRSSTRGSTTPTTASSTPQAMTVPGAEAKTEKLPAQRPSDLPPDRPV